MSGTDTGVKSSGMYFRYFVYSAEEENIKMQLYGNNASFGTVMVKGVPKRYTSIVVDMNDAKPDALVLIKGDIRKIKYIPPKRER